LPTKILCVEDARDLADVVVNVLEFHFKDVEVQVAGDGMEGVKMAREWDPDLILLDLMMPRADGVEVIHRLRRDSKVGDVPIVVISAWAGSGTQLDSIVMKAGANAVFAKPVEAEQLLNIVARYARSE
jgi:CheY-like chemotaxis protein